MSVRAVDASGRIDAIRPGPDSGPWRIAMKPWCPLSRPCRLPRAARVLVVTALLVALAASPGRAWQPDPTAPDAALETFHDHFSAVVYPYARHTPKPLGTLGFDVWAEAAGEQGQADKVDPALDGSLQGGLLGVYRVGARKGLPGGVDVGLSYGKVIDSDLKLVSGEVSWALLEGGLAEPALGIRLTGSRTTGGSDYRLEQYGAEVALSKGFAVLTPYVGAGVSWSQSTFRRPADDFTVDSTRGFLYGGVIVNLLVPKITLEVEQGETLQGAIRIAVGL